MKSIVLAERVAFDAPVQSDDGSGGIEVGWSEVYACRAEFIYSRGSEAVDQARLQGRAFYKVRIRSGAAAKGITTDHRMRDVRRSVTYNIREVDAISDRAWVYIVAESGVNS